MTDQVDWHWGVSNAGKDNLLLWLEPWADEIEIPQGSTATLLVENALAQQGGLDVQDTGDHLVIWAGGGDRIMVYVDQILQNSGSAIITVPDAFGSSTRKFLGILFEDQPAARLAGREVSSVSSSIWRGFLRRLGF